MRVLLQRVRRASVTFEGTLHGAIGHGLLLLVAIRADDGDDDAAYIARKVVHLRVFDDDNGVMNRSVTDIGGELLVVSQFTLLASTRNGARPSWSNAAPPEIASPLFVHFVATLAALFGKPVATGAFGARMAVELVNDGPVTIMIDSRLRE